MSRQPTLGSDPSHPAHGSHPMVSGLIHTNSLQNQAILSLSRRLSTLETGMSGISDTQQSACVDVPATAVINSGFTGNGVPSACLESYGIQCGMSGSTFVDAVHITGSIPISFLPASSGSTGSGSLTVTVPSVESSAGITPGNSRVVSTHANATTTDGRAVPLFASSYVDTMSPSDIELSVNFLSDFVGTLPISVSYDVRLANNCF